MPSSSGTFLAAEARHDRNTWPRMPFRLSDTEWVLIVVAAIYLFECAFWVRREVICLCTLFGRFRDLPSPAFMGNERYKLVMGNPSPLARSFVCELWPMAVSPDGICLPRGMWISPSGEAACHLAFDAIAGGVAAVEKEVYVQGGAIARCASQEQAQRLAAMLKEVAVAS